MVYVNRSTQLFDAVRQKLAELESEIVLLGEQGHIDWESKNLPDDVRSKLLTLGASISDHTFWVRRKAQPDDLSDSPESQMYWAQEMEAGTGAWGVTVREALDHYLSDDLLDRRWTHEGGLDLDYPGDEPGNRRAD